ncbi:MAG: homocysteine S-methyltransferase family protein [Anaerolineae bacterium]|jgi:5-methyltetrahydrofolate--homocysteine methyltransferase
MTRSETLLDRLRAGQVLLADGATGTMLQGMGLAPGEAPEAWLLDKPDQIRALHRGYVEAGSDLILSCSFGGSRFRLADHGLDDRVAALNRRAAELARQVAAEAEGRTVFVAGDMGPTGQLLAPLGPLSPEEVQAAYAEQARGLAEGGADFFLIETMSDLGEARAAIAGARQAADLPIFCTFSFDTHGRTMMGIRPAQVASEMAPLVAGLGANCGQDPAEYVEFVAAMRAAAPGAILWVKPNAGLPHMVEDEVVYDATPEQMAGVAVQLRGAGARVIGGCCGTTPGHVAAMAKALRNHV